MLELIRNEAEKLPKGIVLRQIGASIREYATMRAMRLHSYPKRTLSLAVLLLHFCGGAMAFSALQFDASASRSVSRTGGAVSAWASTRGGVIASSCHVPGCGWSPPFYGGGESIDFIAASGVASPLSFSLTETGLVSRVFIVADATDAAFCSTLLDAPCPLRLFSSEEEAAFYFATSSVLSTFALSIDFAPSMGFAPGPHLYEVRLDEPCPLNELHIGGNPATPAWNRNWNGSVNEVIFTAPSTTETDAMAIRSYLSKKWRIGRYRSGVGDELAVLRALGIRVGSVYGSMLIMR